MDNINGQLLLEEHGVLVNQVEIKNPVDGSHCRIKLANGRLIIRVLKRGSGKGPGIGIVAIVPGHEIDTSDGEARLVWLLPSFRNNKLQASFPVVVTSSFKSAVASRLTSIWGDLIEEFDITMRAETKTKARIWLTRQVLASIIPVVGQMLRYDVPTGIKGWRVWGTISAERE